MLNFNETVYGVDFGSDTAKIYTQRKDRITAEKNMIAVRGEDQVIAVGNQAYEMFEKNPPDIDVRTPVEEGMIADADRGGFVLDKLLLRADARRGMTPLLYFAAPAEMSRLEKRAYKMCGMIAGIPEKRIFLVDQPYCDALSVSVPIHRTKGSMLLNIGAQHTVVSIISQGQIVLMRRIPAGGRHMDEAIADLVRRQTNVRIGTRTAARLKHAMGSLSPRDDARRMVGMDTLSGVPGEVVVTADTVREAILSVIGFLADETAQILTRLPREMAESIRAEGVHLLGGCAKLPEIGEYFSGRIGMPVSADPAGEFATIRGIRELTGHKSLRKLAYPAAE